MMKKKGILHGALLELIASAGHADLIVVADRGFPLPSETSGVKVIDLGITQGLPSFLQIVSLVCEELAVEAVIHAEESLEKCPEYIAEAKKFAGSSLRGSELPCTLVSHARFKTAAVSGFDEEFGRVIGFIRTGEFTPYANIMLRCGVVF